MSLLSIVLALILEQLRPLSQQRYVREPLTAYGHLIEEYLNDGQWHHGLMAWLFAMVLPLAVLGALQYVLSEQLPAALLVLHVLVLYLTMGFRQFSHNYTEIHMALRLGEVERARKLLGEWRGCNADHMSSQEVARLAIEEALLASHHHVFAPLFCYTLFGPLGAMAYRLALFFKKLWGAPEQQEFGEAARQAFAWLDWLPIRVTAALFAMVGNFEDAIYCWRSQAGHWPEPGSGILLASGAGALGVRLGQPVHGLGEVGARPELGSGEEADADFMQSAIGLVWRSLVLCVLLLALFGFARWVG